MTEESKNERCAFSLSPQLNRIYQSRLRNEWRCPRASNNESEYCIFHIPIDKKEASEVKRALKQQILHENPRARSFIGAKLPSINLTQEILSTDDNKFIDFRHSHIEGDLLFTGSTIAQPVLLSGATITGNLLFNRAEIRQPLRGEQITVEGEFSCVRTDFQSELKFRNAQFQGGTTFRDAAFHDSSSFYGCHFGVDEKIQLGKLDGHELDLKEELIFHSNPLNFNNIKISGTLNLNSSTFEGYVDIECNAQNGALLLSDITLLERYARHEYNREKFDANMYDPSNGVQQNQIATISGKYDRLSVSPERIKIEAGFISLEGATVHNGVLSQPEQGTVVYLLTRAKLGDVDIDEEAFSFYVFKRTDFDGLDFTEYRNLLDENRYAIHNTPAINCGVIEYTTEDLETTYQKAKNGAERIDDRLSEGQFYVREMSYRKQRFHEIMTDKEARFSRRLRGGFRFGLNKLLGISTGYGERLWLIGVNSGILLGLSWFAFLFGGVSANGNETPYHIGNVISGQHGILESLWITFYFSAVTFTTLGYGDVEPASALTQGVAAIESILGTILVALLVFSLGRRVQR